MTRVHHFPIIYFAAKGRKRKKCKQAKNKKQKQRKAPHVPWRLEALVHAAYFEKSRCLSKVDSSWKSLSGELGLISFAREPTGRSVVQGLLEDLPSPAAMSPVLFSLSNCWRRWGAGREKVLLWRHDQQHHVGRTDARMRIFSPLLPPHSPCRPSDVCVWTGEVSCRGENEG